MPKWCPDTPVMLSGYSRNRCPDASEICTPQGNKRIDHKNKSHFMNKLGK
ncbi:MAG: hypothetical protein HPY74_15725 [Firmicutes bacterium]|nr:hypothetical protein [Bacillota bacterium]